MSFVVGKPSDAHYNFATVVETVDFAAPTNLNGRETNGKIVIRNTLGTKETYSLESFFLLFREDDIGARRIKGSLETAGDVLQAQSQGDRGRDFADLVALPGKDGKPGKIALKDRQYDADYEGVRYFVNGEGKGLEITDVHEDGSVMFRLIEDFKKPQPKKDKNGATVVDKDGKPVMEDGSVKAVGASRWRSPEALHLMLEKLKLHPYHAPKAPKIEEIQETPFETSSFFKGLFHHASWHDIVKGFMKIPDVVKHRLEHSSKHHSAHAALAIAGKIPFFPKEWLVDFERELNGEDKKMLEEDIEHLQALNPPQKRQLQIRAWLMEKNSTPNEIIASICTMLEKHGNLYVGALKDLEGSWIYFMRLPGSKAEKEAFRAELRVKYNGREITEEFVIHEWLKIRYSELHLNPAYWKMVKDRWEKGAREEKENGGKGAQEWPTYADRLTYAYGKIVNDQEYSHAIGAMEESWNKPGPLKDRMKLPFLFAATNIRDGVHSSLLQKFTGMFDAGHTYPPLLFIQDPYRQKLFRNVVEKLAVMNGCGDDFALLRELMAGELSKDNQRKYGEEIKKIGFSNFLIKKAAAFWDANGDKLTKQLLIQPSEPVIFLRSKDPKSANYDPELAAYRSIVSGELDDTKADDAEASMGLYGADNANWALLNAKRTVSLVTFQSGPGELNNAGDIYAFGEFVKNLDVIRNARYSENEDENRATKMALFRELHWNFMKVIPRKVSSDWWKDDGPNGMQRVETKGWMIDLMNRGFRMAESADPKWLEGDAYEAWLERDFERFMNGADTPIPRAGTVRERVITSSDEVLGYSARPAGEPNVRPMPNEGPNNGSESGTDLPPSGPAPTPPPTRSAFPHVSSIPDGNARVAPSASAPTQSSSASVAEGVMEARGETSVSVESEPLPPEGDAREADVSETSEPENRRTADGTFAEFESDIRRHAWARSHIIAEYLRNLGIEIPKDVENGDWALEKISARLKELEPYEFFQAAQNFDEIRDFDLVHTDELETRLGQEIRQALKRGERFRSTLPENRRIHRLLSTEGLGIWWPSDLRYVGKAAMNGKLARVPEPTDG